MKKNIYKNKEKKYSKSIHLRVTKENEMFLDQLYKETDRAEDGKVISKNELINRIIEKERLKANENR